jgi:formylglycine-generating enzyme
MVRRSRFVVAAVLVLGATPSALASCELLDGLGNVMYKDASAPEGLPSDGGSDGADMGETEGAPPCVPPMGCKQCGMVRVTPAGAVAKPFCIGSTEVTNSEFEGFARVVEAGHWDAMPACREAHLLPTSQLDGASSPVVNVDWCGAAEYCRWISAGLCAEPDPTVDIWSRACMGPDGSLFPYGNHAVEGQCNVGAPDGGPGAVPWNDGSCHGGYAGIFDMVGNVAEWGECDDSGACVVRGGSYASMLDASCLGAEKLPPSTRSPSIGMRCCVATQIMLNP